MDSLRELQLTELNILKELLPIFERHSIPYFALGGTMLGAVRHGGFIPWDDDIDIGVPREDYDRLLSLEGELPPHLHFMSRAENPDYVYYFMRVVDERIKLRNRRFDVEEVLPAWVDIFPLDGLPNTELRRKLHSRKILASRAVFQLSRFENIVNTRRDRPPLEQAVIRIVRTLHLQKLIGRDYAYRLMDRTLKQFPYGKSDYNVNAMGAYRMKEAFPKDVFGEGALYPYEDIMIRGASNYDAYLTQLYGDWRTPADADHHSVVEIIRESDAATEAEENREGEFDGPFCKKEIEE